MRDPKRIKGITKKMTAYWLKHPDLRFFQVIDIIKVKIDPRTPFKDDPYYIEDNKVQDSLDELT